MPSIAELRTLVSIIAFGWVLSASASAAEIGCDEKSAGYVRPFLADSDTVIVFVHGLAGHPYETWRSADAEKSWPCLLRGDEAFQNANIYLYGYDTGFMGKRPGITEVAKSAKDDLQRVLVAHDQVIFVVHSMGGLVAAQSLISMAADSRHQDLVRRVKLVTFFGTPGGGSALARAASLVSMNVQLADLTGGQTIDDIVQQWNASPIFSNRSRCFAESEPEGGFLYRNVGALILSLLGADNGLVVAESSAFATCRGKGQRISSVSHSSLVKPIHTQDGAYRQLVNQAQACARPARLRSQGLSLAGRPQAQQVRQWRSRFAAELTTKDRRTLEQQVERFLARQADGATLQEAYVLPPNPGAPQIGLQRGEVSSRFILQALIDEPVVGPEQIQYDLAFARDVNAIVVDGEVRSRVGALRAGGLILDDDLAVLVDDPSSNDQGLLLLLLAASPGSDMALKGFLRIAGPPRCQSPSRA